MASKNEYKLSYTAKDIDKKLLRVDGLSAQMTAMQNVDADLQAQISNKANSSHSHKISDVENLQSTLDEIRNNVGNNSNGGSDGNITIEYDVATQTNDGLMAFEDKIQLDYGGVPIVATSSSNGIAYAATVDGIKELKKGAKITIIPNMTSKSKAITLNVNNLGAKNIRIPSANTTAGSSDGLVEDWLSAEIPVTIQYNGTYWITTDFMGGISTTTNISGVVSVESGGTGATTASEALKNLGAAPMYQYGNVDIGTGAYLPTGVLYFVHE